MWIFDKVLWNCVVYQSGRLLCVVHEHQTDKACSVTQDTLTLSVQSEVSWMIESLKTASCVVSTDVASETAWGFETAESVTEIESESKKKTNKNDLWVLHAWEQERL
jgi:hypothetical protein